MKQRIFLLFILSVLLMVPNYAQIKVTTYNEGENVIFEAESHEYGSYTLVLNFTELTGYERPWGNVVTTVVGYGHNSVYRLQKEGNGPSAYRYTYQYYQGKDNARPDKDFPYILPLKEGESTEISELENIEAKLGKTGVDKTLGIAFSYTGTDTIYAIRSGLVINVKEKEPDAKETQANTVYNRSRTIISVEHQDGTIARYTCITSGKSLLDVGDRIIAGQPLAVFTSENDRQQIGIDISYLKNSKRKILIPKFYTADGLIQLKSRERYITAFTKKIIEKELTKKEKKKLNL